MKSTEVRPETLYEEASYDLNKFRERRMMDRRFKPRDTPDRRKSESTSPESRETGKVPEQ